MEHILTERGIDFEPYAAYLATIASRLPEHVRAFATNSKHYQLDGSDTLHDAWLESLQVDEPASGDRSQFRKCSITLRLLGPMHDQFHVLKYTDVATYSMRGVSVGRGHGDLLTHEVRLSSDDKHIVHELLFQSHSASIAGSITIECADFRYFAESISAK